MSMLHILVNIYSYILCSKVIENQTESTILRVRHVWLGFFPKNTLSTTLKNQVVYCEIVTKS